MRVLKLFSTQPYKILPFSKQQKWPKYNKNICSRMLDGNKLCHIIPAAGFKITQLKTITQLQYIRKRKYHIL